MYNTFYIYFVVHSETLYCYQYSFLRNAFHLCLTAACQNLLYFATLTFGTVSNEPTGKNKSKSLVHEGCTVLSQYVSLKSRVYFQRYFPTAISGLFRHVLCIHCKGYTKLYNIFSCRKQSDCCSYRLSSLFVCCYYW